MDEVKIIKCLTFLQRNRLSEWNFDSHWVIAIQATRDIIFFYLFISLYHALKERPLATAWCPSKIPARENLHYFFFQAQALSLQLKYQGEVQRTREHPSI